jgi:hypothetical protein
MGYIRLSRLSVLPSNLLQSAKDRFLFFVPSQCDQQQGRIVLDQTHCSRFVGPPSISTMLSKYWMLKGALLCLLARLDFGEAFTLLVGQQPGGDLRPKLQTRRLSSSEALPEGGGIPPQDGLADGSMGQKTGDLWLPATPTAPSESMVRSVNYFISRACNYSCEFCFHVSPSQRTPFWLSHVDSHPHAFPILLRRR